jgi:hypothetical protein
MNQHVETLKKLIDNLNKSINSADETSWLGSIIKEKLENERDAIQAALSALQEKHEIKERLTKPTA